MRLIFLLVSRNARRWLCSVAIAFAWLGMCQPATAAPTCSGAVDSMLIMYSGSAVSGSSARMLQRYGCSGMTTGGATNYFAICTTTDAATSSGSGGASITPYRTAKSSVGNTLNYQLVKSSDSTNLTASGIMLNNGSFGSAYSAIFATAYGIGISIPASQSVAAGDYVATVPITVDYRFNSSAFTSCSQGTSANTYVYNLPVVIRVGGASCSITFAPNISLGNITVNAGSVARRDSSGSEYEYFRITCAANTAWTATFSDGNNPLGTGSDRRRLINGSSYLTYQISKSGPTYLVDSTGITGTGTGSSQAIGFVVTIPAQTPASLTPGLYTDTVIMSLSY
jgi:spore coat protein U-like protein